MHTRKHTVGRNILRVFEIALFFAVSVLGYGLLMKASSFNSKSKTREQTPGLQSTPDLTGGTRALSVIPGKLIFSQETALSASQSGIAGTIEACHALNCSALCYPAMLTSVPDHSRRYDHNSDPFLLPHNLLQQNPVLLI
jgi:hypothetical protein